MKTLPLRRGGGFVIAIYMMALVASAKDGPTTAKIARLIGTAQYSTDGSTWQPLSKGMTVKSGTTIRTAGGVYADVVLGAPVLAADVDAEPGSLVYFPVPGVEQVNIVRINENSVLAIDLLNENRTGADVISDTQLDLRTGSIYVSVKKGSAASRFEVKFPAGVAGFQGTSGFLDHTGVAHVLRGTLHEAYRQPDDSVKTQVIQALQMWDPRADRLTQLTAEAKTSIQQALEQDPIELRTSTIAGQQLGRGRGSMHALPVSDPRPNVVAQFPGELNPLLWQASGKAPIESQAGGSATIYLASSKDKPTSPTGPPGPPFPPPPTNHPPINPPPVPPTPPGTNGPPGRGPNGPPGRGSSGG